MIRYDIYDQPTTLPDAAAFDAWNAMMGAFMAHGASTSVHLGEVLERAPDHAGALACNGLFMALLGRREMMAEARSTYMAALRADGANRREATLVRALGRMIEGQPTSAVAELEGWLDLAPGDMLAVKLGHAIRFLLGDAAGMRASVERVMPAYDTDHAGRGYLLGCHAFALEETGDYAAARLAGRAALTLVPDDAWGLHAVAHVHDMTGDAAGGLDWLEGREAAWAHCNNFRFHVWWHKALMLLDVGRLDEALALYDADVRAERTDDFRDIANATSLLMRLELEGMDVGDRWEELADLSEGRTEDGCLIFADLHYMLALAKGGRAAAADRLLARIAADGARAQCDVSERMGTPGLSAADGVEAFAEGDYARAFKALSAARHTMARVGGSHAQRDVFERLTVDAGIRAGRLADAEAVLEDRTRRRGHEDGFAAARGALIARAARRPLEARA